MVYSKNLMKTLMLVSIIFLLFISVGISFAYDGIFDNSSLKVSDFNDDYLNCPNISTDKMDLSKLENINEIDNLEENSLDSDYDTDNPYYGNVKKTDKYVKNDENTIEVNNHTHKTDNYVANATNTTEINNITKFTNPSDISELIEAPRLVKLQYYPKNNYFYSVFVWKSKINSTYQVLRKDTGDFEVISTVKATSSQMTFYDKITNNASYTYSVREIVEDDGIVKFGSFNSEGLKLIRAPDVTVDFQNLMANITWDKIENVSKYRIFRKVGRDGTFKCIAVVDGNESCYLDYYYLSGKELSSILNNKIYADPSFNSLFYTVRAVNIKDDNSVSYGLYLKDGDFNLESPSIVSLVNNRITWGKVPNADGYLILKRNETNMSWEVIGQSKPKASTTLSMVLNNVDYNAYYSVQAFSSKNGETVYSKFDEGFTLRNYSKYNSQYRILYFGDSITYGSPYKSTTSMHIFSYPYRVAQLTGSVYYNPSIPGSTYHDLGVNEDGLNIINTKYYRYRICREVVDPIFIGELPGNWKDLDNAKNSEGIANTCLEDYNIVVLAAGTNDYLDNTRIGSHDSNDTITFNGAFNHIMEKIELASKNRVEKGDSPIKVIFVDLFYCDRTYTYTLRENRDITPNQIGLTLMDYQNALDEQYEKWSNSDYLKLFNFKTRSYDIVNQDNCPYTASDNLHFTKFTYGQYGNALAQFLLENVFTFKVSKLNASDIEIEYNENASWKVVLSDELDNPISNAKIDISINGIEGIYSCVSDENGVVRLPVNLTPGTYQVHAVFKGDSVYAPSSVNATIIVDRISTVLSADDLVMFYRDGHGWNISLSDVNGFALSNKAVRIAIRIASVDKVYSRVSDDDGVVLLPINLAPGSYDVTATFEGDSVYAPSFVNATVHVEKAMTDLSCESLSMFYGDGSSFKFKLTNAEGYAISGMTVKIGIRIGSVDKVYSRVSDEDGVVLLPINLAPGTYHINATFVGNSKYQATFANSTVTVNKAILRLTGEDLIMNYKDGSAFKVNLTDSEGNPFQDMNIQFTIGNAKYNIKTDSNGSASLPINLAVGNYSIDAVINNAKFQSNSITHLITVGTDKLNIASCDVNMVYKDGTFYQVQLVDGVGKPVHLSGQIIKVTVNNKIYNLKTNSEGIVKLAINLSKGNYTFEAKYNENIIRNNVIVNA